MAVTAQTIPHKCLVCPVRSQRAPFCWTDLQAQLAHLAGVALRRQLERGEALYRQGDEATGWWIVRHGRVLEYMVDPGGREQIIRLVSPGGVAGICGLGHWRQHWAGARAGHTGAEVCYIPREQAHRIMAEHPALAACLLAGMAEEVRRAYSLLYGMVTLPARAAVAMVLLSAAEQDAAGRWLVLLTRREIASMVGVTLETVVRILGQFRAQGAVRDVGQSTMELVDACRLHAISEGLDLACERIHDQLT